MNKGDEAAAVNITALPGLVGQWLEGGVIRTGVVPEPQALVSRLGDELFLNNASEGIVRQAWEDRELFSFLYGGDLELSIFGSVDDKLWRRHRVHRKAFERAEGLREIWAGCWNRMLGVMVVFPNDKVWMRELGRVHVKAITLAVGKPGWSALSFRSSAVPVVEELAVIRKAREEIENKFHTIYARGGILQYLRQRGVPVSDIHKERMGLVRAMRCYWPWATADRKIHGKQPGLTVELPELGENGEITKRSVELVSARTLACWTKTLGGELKVLDIASRAAKFCEDLLSALLGRQPLENNLFMVVTALGLTIKDGHLSGRLCRRWRRVMTNSISNQMALAGLTSPLGRDMNDLVGAVGEKFFKDLGLIEPESLKWDGREVAMPLVVRVERVTAEEFFANNFSQQDAAANPKRNLIGMIGGGDSQRTVYRSIFAAKIPKEAKSFWAALEKAKGSILVTQTVGDLRLSAVVDGMARAYLEGIGMGTDRYGKSSVGVGGDFRLGVNPVENTFRTMAVADALPRVWAMADAALASQVWALSQLLGATGSSQESLGLSGGYRLRLRKVFSLMVPVIGYHRSGTWRYGGQELLAGVNLSGGLGTKMLRSASPAYDALFYRRPAEPSTFKLMSLDVPTVVQIPGDLPAGMSPRSIEYALRVPRSMADIMTKGFFQKQPTGNWAFVPDGTGVVVPGIENEGLARAYSQLSGLFAEQANMHPRAMMVAILEAAYRGKFPKELKLLSPVGFAGWPNYLIKGVLPCAGLSAVDLVWRRPVAEMPVDHIAALANFDTPVWTGADYDRELGALASGFSAVPGALWGIWQGVLDRPSVARLGMLELSQVVYVARVLKNLQRGIHPMTLVPLAAGGGCPKGAEEWTRKIWGPMFKSGQVPTNAGKGVELTSALATMASLIDTMLQ